MVHVSLVPVLGVVGEQKTKPSQHSVRELRALGLSPHILACRSSSPLEKATKEKLAQFCHVPPSHILSLFDVGNIWHVPLLMYDQGVLNAIFSTLGLDYNRKPDLTDWQSRAFQWDQMKEEVLRAN